jgi:imidazolonepropionase-like amidohydrolase
MRLRGTAIILALAPAFLHSQVPAPVPPQAQPVCITGATAHLGNGRVIENSFIAFAEGKITLVGSASQAPADLSAYRVIEAAGRHVYPGFIAPATSLGLVDISSVRATRDFQETGDMNPSVRSLIAYNTDSEVIATVRARGVLLAQVSPEGGRISGTSSVVQLDAWNWEDAAYRVDDGLFLNWPVLSSFNWREQSVSENKDYAKQVGEVRDFFREAKAYLDNPGPAQKNLKFEAMRPLFAGQQRLYVRAQDAKAIAHAVQFASEFGLKAAIVGGRDAWMVASLLKENEVAVVLQKTHSLPPRVDSDIDQPFKTPAALEEAGVLYCFSNDGYWQQRNLPFQAGQAIGYGLSHEKAVQALTLNPAKIMGIDARTGTLETGKDANLFISAGDALDLRTSRPSHVFIQGREITLEDKQKSLYEKFKAKYQQPRR